jgi:Family of unknown function (DUF6088)
MKEVRKIAELVRRKIKNRGPGATVSYTDFSGLPLTAVAKILSRLVISGDLVRVKKGIYYLPKATALGKTKPSLSHVLAKTEWSHKLLGFAAGANLASQNLGISTQLPAETVLVGDYTNRSIDLMGSKIKTRRRATAHLKHLSKTEFYVLETLRHLNKIADAHPVEAIKVIKKHVKASNIELLAHAALKEPPRVRALLGAILSEIGGHAEPVERLRKSLNPLTTYKIGVTDYLRHASAWRIK